MIVVIIIRFLIGSLFVFSGIIKLSDIILFKETVEQFDVLSGGFINIAAVVIPPVEIICGLFLVLNIFRKPVSVLLTALLSVFLVAMGINLYRGTADFSCGCFGQLEIFNTISPYSILFNLSLIAGLLTVYLKDKTEVDLFEQLKPVMTYIVFGALIVNISLNYTTIVNSMYARSIQRIDFIKALELIEKQDALLFDARPNDRYESEHVPGALSLPAVDFQGYFSKYLPIDKERPLLVYCDGIDCSNARRVAYKLAARGYRHIYDIPEGWEGWKLRH